MPPGPRHGPGCGPFGFLLEAILAAGCLFAWCRPKPEPVPHPHHYPHHPPPVQQYDYNTQYNTPAQPQYQYTATQPQYATPQAQPQYATPQPQYATPQYATGGQYVDPQPPAYSAEPLPYNPAQQAAYNPAYWTPYMMLIVDIKPFKRTYVIKQIKLVCCNRKTKLFTNGVNAYI